MDNLSRFFVPEAKGMRIDRDPDELPPGSLADACNVALARPVGVVTPRRGSQTPNTDASAAIGGHPKTPLGNARWDFSARVLRLVADEKQGRLWAICRTQAGKAKAYRMDLSIDGPGFDTGTTEFDVDDAILPGAVASNNRLFIAPGTSGSNVNQVADATGIAFNALAPPKPATITAVPGAGTPNISAATGYIYAACVKDSKTLAHGPLIQATTTGPFTAQQVTVTVAGTVNQTTFDRIAIFRTTDGGNVLRYLTEVANPGSGFNATYVDFTQDDNLSYIIAPRRFGRVPTCRFCWSWLDRVFWAHRTETAADGSVVYFSEPFHPFAVDPVVNVVNVRPEDGDSLTGHGSLYNRMFLFKSRQIYELARNDPLSPFRVDPVVNEGAIGCVSPATIVEIEGRLFFLGFDGVGMFDGQTPSLIPGPLTAAGAERQVWADELFADQRLRVRMQYRNPTDVTRRFYWRVFFMSGPNDVPGVDTPALELYSQTAPERFLVNGLIPPGNGYQIAGLDEVNIEASVLPNELTRGATFWIWFRGVDAATLNVVDTVRAGTYTHTAFQVFSSGVNWGLRETFFALDYWPRREYWLFTASPGSDLIDTRWVLDYGRLFDAQELVWRRDIVQATAAVLPRGVNLSATQRGLLLPILGDANGCIWAGEIGGIDHHIQRATPLTHDQRHGTGTLSVNAGVWTLTAAGSPAWPATGVKIKGERVVVRDVFGHAYSGLVTDNTASALTIPKWLEGRTPAIGAVTYALGGLDAHVDYYPMPVDEGQRVVEVHQLLLRGGGRADVLDVELWVADQPELLSPAMLARLRSRDRYSDVTVGGGEEERVPAFGRGRYVGARLGSIRAEPRWRLAALGFAVRPTGSPV